MHSCTHVKPSAGNIYLLQAAMTALCLRSWSVLIPRICMYPDTVETLLTHTPREGVEVMGYEGLWDKGGSATDKRPRVR